MTIPAPKLELTPRPERENPKGMPCGRPISRGTCRMPRLIVYGCPWYKRLSAFGGDRLDMQWEMGGCKRHLTDAEQTFVKVAEQLAATEESMLQYVREREAWDIAPTAQTKPPMCWSWFDVDRLAHERGYPVTVPTDLASLEKWHRARCAVCGRVEALVYDHDHWSGLVRGMLCWTCNTNEPKGGGMFTLYRHRHPARIFNLRIPYTVGMRPLIAGPRPGNGYYTRPKMTPEDHKRILSEAFNELARKVTLDRMVEMYQAPMAEVYGFFVKFVEEVQFGGEVDVE